MNTYIDTIFNQIINNFDFAYMLIINILTYLIIDFIIKFNKKDISVIKKRCIFVLSTIIITICYIYNGYDNKIILINSAILAPMFWGWILKPILNKFKIGYKDINNKINV